MRALSRFFRVLPTIIFIIALAVGEEKRTFVVLIVSVLIHEAAHFLIYILMGGHGVFRHVTGGFMMETGRGAIPYIYELALAGAGPLANFTTAILFLAMRGGHIGIAVEVNLSLATANLLPIKTLDGGRIAYAVCTLVFPYKTGEKVADILSVLCAFSLVFFSLYVWFRTGGGEYLVFFSFICLARHFANDKCQNVSNKRKNEK